MQCVNVGHFVIVGRRICVMAMMNLALTKLICIVTCMSDYVYGVWNGNWIYSPLTDRNHN
jgi:hypothetical protein